MIVSGPFRGFCLLPIAWFLMLFAAQGQVLRTEFPETNGAIESFALKGDTLFMAGGFTHLFTPGNSTRYVALFNDSNERPSLTDMPDGIVRAVVPDGAGGYYIGGEFTYVGDSARQNLAHIDAKGKVTGRVNLKPNNRINALALVEEKLYIGGKFTQFGNRIETHGTPVNIKDANVNLNALPVRGDVYCSVSDGKGGWYIGGDFTDVGGIQRNHAAHIDHEGNLYPWAPNISNAVYAIASEGTHIYLGGTFDSVSQAGYRNIVAVDAIDGNLIASNFNLSVNNAVTTIVIANGVLYAGGFFSKVNDSTRNRLFAYDLNNHQLLPWRPSVDDGYVKTIAVLGNKVYFGGSFTKVNNITRSYIAAVNATTGTLLSGWNPGANGRVNVITGFASQLYVGGEFSQIGTQTRNYLASFDTSSAIPNSWNPDPDGTVHALIRQGPVIYVGGGFRNISRLPRLYAAALEIESGNALTWAPNPDDLVFTLCVSGPNVYTGGVFAHIGGENRNFVAAIDLKKDSLDQYWKPEANGEVNVLHISRLNGMVYVGGIFNKVRNISRTGFAALDQLNADVQPLNIGVSDSVYAIETLDSFVYVGGAFSTVKGQPQANFAAFHVRDGSNKVWANPTVSGPVYAIAAAGGKVVIGGEFNSVTGTFRSNLAAVDLPSGILLDWNATGTDAPVFALKATGNDLYVGGSFSVCGGSYVNQLAKVSLDKGIPSDWPVYVSDRVYALTIAGRNIMAVGAFVKGGGVNRNYLAAIHAKWGDVFPWNPKANAKIKKLYLNGDKLFCAGQFSKIGNDNRKGFAELDIASGRVTELDLNMRSGEVLAMLVKDSLLYLGGSFDSLLNQPRTYLGVLNRKTNLLTSWAPVFDGYVYGLAARNDELYASGVFSLIDTTYRSRLVRFDLLTKAVHPWNPGVEGIIVRDICIGDSLLYLCGNFTKIGPFSRRYLANISLATGAPKGLSAGLTAPVTSMFLYGSRIYYTGSFFFIDTALRKFVASTTVSNNKLTSWMPNPDGNVNAVLANDNMVYIGGPFFDACGLRRINLAAMDDGSVPCILNVSINNSKPNGFCLGDSTLLSYQPVQGRNYQWTYNGNKMPGFANVPLQAKVSGTYGLWVTDSASGCIDKIATIDVKATNLPAKQKLTSTDQVHLCPGDSVQLYVGYSPATQYKWYKNNQLLNLADSVFRFYVTDSGTYFVKIISAAGCSQFSDPSKISQENNPLPQSASGLMQVHNGMKTGYKTTGVSGVQSEWTLQNGTLITGAGSDSIGVFWGSSPDTGVVTLVKVTEWGCRSSATTMQVKIVPYLICLKDTLVILNATDTAASLEVFSNVSWNVSSDQPGWCILTNNTGNNNGGISLKTYTNPFQVNREASILVQSPNASATARIRQLATTDLIAVVNDTIQVSADVHDLQVPLTCNTNWSTQDPASWAACTPLTGNGNTNLSIHVNKNSSSNPRQVSYLFKAGTAYVFLWIIQSGSVGVEELSVSDFQLYPNPAQQELHLENRLNAALSIRISDITGKERGSYVLSSHETRTVSPDLEPGMYLASMESGHKARVVRFAVVR